MAKTRSSFIGFALLLFGSSFAFGLQADSESGMHVLERGAIRLSISLPGDQQNYRGTRFDHSGMIHRIQFGEHQLCERWKSGAPDLDANDDVTGPCEEFGNSKPLGYLPNRPGTHFVKIGVGILKQPAEPEYRFWSAYEFVQRGTWATAKTSNSMTFQQSIFDDPVLKSIGYEYEKTIRLTENGFRIEHRLKNLGTADLSTDHYNHNFFLIDSDKVGPNYELHLPFKIEPVERKASFDEVTTVKDNTVRFRELVGSRSFFSQLNGHANQVGDHQFRLKHLPTGVGIECKGSSPLSKMNFWGMGNTICPEPYTQIHLKPNEQFEWNLDYVLSVDPSRSIEKK